MIPNDKHAPFHTGEQQMQVRAGKLAQMDEIGRRVIRSFMPDQHRQFFSQLPFLVIGSTDAKEQLWASILPGLPGFVQSDSPTELNINTGVLKGDPLKEALTLGSRLGILGIEVPSRRRNRVNGRISAISGQQFSVQVEQSFGNCPQYIQTRDIKFIRCVNETFDAPAAEHFSRLDIQAKTLIGQADTFFVASSAGNATTNSDLQTSGVDVSHRGGMPGFVSLSRENNSGDKLTIPDYAGNNFFNTMGNFIVNPKAGLLFADFVTGDLLMLSGTVEILWEDDPRIIAFKGAQRGWQFTLTKGIRLKNALPFSASFNDYSPEAKRTGTWEHANAQLKTLATRNSWQSYKVSHIKDESSTIRSFYLQPSNSGAVLPFKAGQHLTLRFPIGAEHQHKVRNYTVSSAPGADHYRISVKREANGLVSRVLHNTLAVGSLIDIKAPRGEFFIDDSVKHPVVLIGAGVGITPMIAMAQDALNEGARTGYTRPMSIIHAAKNIEQRAFNLEFKGLQQNSGDKIRYYSVLSNVSAYAQQGTDYAAKGRISAAQLQQILDLQNAHARCDVYLCGPQGFMQDMYDTLISLGVTDINIHAETFGPSTLLRQSPDSQRLIKKQNRLAPGTKNEAVDEANSAMIEFTQAQLEQPWHKGDPTILEVAEAHGLTPEFSCRSGSCGSCAVKMQSGSVVYRTAPSAPIADSEVLICCAVPAKNTHTIRIAL